MILPIEIYNNPILKKNCININESYPKLNELILNMFDTMYNANGIGLAAPQIGINIRLFIIHIHTKIKTKNNKESFQDYKKIFINPLIIYRYGIEYNFLEGCLSIPYIIEYIKRKSIILVEYYNEKWEKNIETIDGLQSRVFQHEYDHIDGILFIDHLSLKKQKQINKKIKAILLKKTKIINYPIKIFSKKENKYKIII